MGIGDVTSFMNIVEKCRNKLYNTERYKIIYFIFAFLCFLIFNFRFDLAVITVGGNLVLDGHILDWYEEFDKLYPSLGVYPMPYFILYAVWNIPIRILSQTSYLNHMDIPYVYILWNKLSIILMMWRVKVTLGKVLYKIDADEAKHLQWAWILMPATFLICIIMGIYDIVYVLIVVEALNFYFSDWSIKKNKILFTLLFGISICFKSTPLVFYIPLILAREKSIKYNKTYLFIYPTVLMLYNTIFRF